MNDTITILLVEDNLDPTELVMRHLAKHEIPNQVTHVCDRQTTLDDLIRSRKREAF
ncbi:MAG: hypothetical protein ACUVRJ_09030 [Candidatus Villigracilaceae bacterium]